MAIAISLAGQKIGIMRITRRGLIAGGLAGALIPAGAGFLRPSASPSANTVLLHDSAISAGRRFARAGRVEDANLLRIRGDMDALAHSMLRQRPVLLVGVSRHEQARQVCDRASRAGYRIMAEVHGGERSCTAFTHEPDWLPLNRRLVAAGGNWPSVLARWGANPSWEDEREDPVAPRDGRREKMALGWIMVRPDWRDGLSRSLAGDGAVRTG